MSSRLLRSCPSFLIACGVLGIAGTAAAAAADEYALIHPTNPRPSAIDANSGTQACYIDSPNSAVGLVTTTGSTQDVWTFTGVTLSEEGIKCQGTSYIFAADSANNQLIRIKRTGSTAYNVPLPTGDGAPYAITSTGSSNDEVWFSTYNGTANSTLYIGHFDSTGLLTMYALPSSVATGGDEIGGLVYTTLQGFHSGAIAFSVYGPSHKTGNFLDLSCSGSGSCYPITTLTWPSATTSETQVALDGNGVFYTALGTGQDTAYRWNVGGKTLITAIDPNYVLNEWLSNDQTWTGTYSSSQAFINMTSSSSVTVTTSSTNATKATSTPTLNTLGTHTPYNLPAATTQPAPTFTSGTNFDNYAPVTTHTMTQISSLGGSEYWFTERGSGIVAHYH